MKKALVILVAILFLLVTGCEGSHYASHSEQLDGISLFGEHQTVRIEHTAGMNGSISGLFFLGTGAVNGQVTAGEKLRFWWLQSQGDLIPTEMPYGMIAVRRDETKQVPTVEFVFDQGWLSKADSWNQFSASDLMNPNLFLNDDSIENGHIVLIIVRISSKDLEKEIFLPHLS